MSHFMKIHPVSFIKAMSYALELSTTGISKHHVKTAIIAKSIGEFMALQPDEMQVLIYSALLHDIGAAANWNEKHYIIHAHNDMEVFHHAEKGYEILKTSPQLSMLAIPIRHHHDRFFGINPTGALGKEIPLASRIIHISDRIDVLINKNLHIFKQRKKILENLETYNFFDPDILKVVIELSKRDYFWLDIVNSEYEDKFFSELTFFGKYNFNIDDMIIIAEIFSKVVDATSHFTASHSTNVANVAAFLAETRGFCQDEVKQIRLAGLLHDLGKLIIPNELLNKSGNLTQDEKEIIRQHPYIPKESWSRWMGSNILPNGLPPIMRPSMAVAIPSCLKEAKSPWVVASSLRQMFSVL